MSLKQKGTNAERDLVHKFWSTPGWVAHRIAGSGSSKYPSPDVIASNNIRRLAIECKTTKDDSVYIPKNEIYELKKFASMFGAEAWVAARFSRQDVLFISLDDLGETQASYVVTRILAKNKGLLFEELVKP